MRINYVPASVIAFLLCGSLTAQSWVNMVKDSKANVHDIQNAFYSNYKANKDKDGDEDGNYELFRRWEWLMAPRTYPTGVRPDMATIAQEYQDFLNKHSDQRIGNTDRTLSSNRWAYAGSSNVPKNGDAGRVNHLRFDPTNNNIIYACTPSGGLWKSTNGGTTWSTNTDKLSDLAANDVAIDPTNTNIMYLATGDGDGIGGGVTTPSTIGVLKSVDGGNTWNPTSLYYTLQASGPSGTTVNEILINPSNHNVLLAATSGGLYITNNAGLTWNLSLSGDIKDIAFEPSHPSIVYATSFTANFYRSTDGGMSFTSVALPSASGAGRMSLAVTAADSNYVYVLAENSSTSAYFAVWLSKNDGKTFTTQSTSPNLLGFSPWGTDNVGQGWYTLSFAASPTNANEVIVGGVNVWRSTDAGTTWSLNAYQMGGPAPYVHADIHHLTYVPGSGTSYYAACDGGIFKTTNSGSSWTDLSNGLEIAEQYGIGLSASNGTLWLTGWQDNGTNMANGATWSETMGGDGMICFIDNTNNNNMYGEQYDGNFNRSTNGGGTWKGIAISTTETPAWSTPWLQDPKAANTLFAGMENVWKSTNQGTSWSKISTWGTGGNYIVAVAVAPSNDQYIYACTYSALMATTNGGTTWKNISGGLPVSTVALTNVTVDPNNPSRLWVTFSGYSATNKVYQSVNGGTTWTDISTGLPNLPVNCIVYHNGGADAMYAGTDMGVYYRDTTNTGGIWVSYNTGLPNVMITDLKIYAPSNTLMAATYGRGTWKVANYTPASAAPIAYFTAFPKTVCAGIAVQFTDTSANSPTSWNWTFNGGTPSSSTAQNPNIVYSTAGVYPVKMVAKNLIGKDSLTINSYITVNPTPPVPTIKDSGSLLTASPSTYPYYQWFKSNVMEPGATSFQYWVPAKGVYKVVVTDSEGCSSSAQIVVTVLGINELSVDDGMKVYPNPTSSSVELAFNGQQEGDYTLELSNILGQTLYSSKLHLAGYYNSTLNMSNYGKGIYFLTLTGNNSKMVKKIVVY